MTEVLGDVASIQSKAFLIKAPAHDAGRSDPEDGIVEVGHDRLSASAEHVGVKATLVLDGSTWKVKRQDITEGSCPAGY